ncbi:response regulator [Mesorhizobium sp. ESP7-2]|uniref:response regulator n=1 Tax=unclassified Mesorhizobium TaxID=325217 RepID=UPI001CCBA710|nr:MULTISPECIES: response regulator [unclassified Mesorhizobium]MBZ9673105.1 response regulator [Mesorhizobium sp. ES1-3]MBZ9709444.1 response regulator [Mesorhizobium sp. ESP7-2]
MTTLSGTRVLLVEDESVIAMMVEDFLTDLGVTVIGPATSINAALELVSTAQIDAAVLDLNIRGELSERVADALRLRRIPMVCATGYGEGAAEFARGAPIIDKPYSKDKLATALQSALHSAGGVDE